MHNEVVSRDEWLNARLALLAQEKELTRLSDVVARRRQEMPRVLSRTSACRIVTSRCCQAAQCPSCMAASACAGSRSVRA